MGIIGQDKDVCPVHKNAELKPSHFLFWTVQLCHPYIRQTEKETLYYGVQVFISYIKIYLRCPWESPNLSMHNLGLVLWDFNYV